MKSQKQKTVGMSLPAYLLGVARRVLLLVMVFVPLVSLAQTATRPAVGDGSSDNPFLISSAENLAWFRDYVNGTYTPDEGSASEPHLAACAKLTADIDMSAVCHPADEASGREEMSWVPISASFLSECWHGVFDGAGHAISNLYINDATPYSEDEIHACGFFGIINSDDSGEHCVVKDIIFKNVEISSASVFVGTVAGTSYDVEINGIIIESGSVEGFYNYGGIIGMATKGVIESCVNHASIRTRQDTNMDNSYCAGGILGTSQAVTVRRSINNGLVDVASNVVGGICGYMQSYTQLEMCANYADVSGNSCVGGVAGFLSESFLNTVLTVGNVRSEQADNQSGLVIGVVSEGLHGFSFYNNEAKLMAGGDEVGETAIGQGPVGSSRNTQGVTRKILQSGYLAYSLDFMENGGWGQRIGVDPYPVPGSKDLVYIEGNVAIRCDGTVISGVFTNTKPAEEGSLTFSHTSSVFHGAVSATCTKPGSKAYYECSCCHNFFSDENMDTPVYDIVIAPTGHDYDFAGGICKTCGTVIPVLEEGAMDIQVPAVYGDKDVPDGYNLYKFVAPGDGELTLYLSGSNDIYGCVWNSDCTEILETDMDEPEEGGIRYKCLVDKGQTYYIGVREYWGDAIEGRCSVALLGTWPLSKDEYAIADGSPWQGRSMSVKALTYTRTFNNTEWQPLYVPFAMSSADWKAQGLEVACVNNFHEYELEDGGGKVVLEVNRVVSGRLHPNTPYLIRATEVGEKTITLNDVELAAAASDAIGCSSVMRSYVFTGIYKEKTDLDADNDYILSGGSIYHSDGALKPQRWYLTITDRQPLVGDVVVQKPRSISVKVIGEGAVTDIADVRVVGDVCKGNTQNSANGIYDLQGRRLQGEPVNGVYIKNGKKYVK